ncbi:MAG: hypothetical protein Q4G49_13450 [Paracoccus sp. (in: a-proteobacteria)]|nr:hypothetical protein [Paracoccus sp. (in: a-proteobacteria)]
MNHQLHWPARAFTIISGADDARAITIIARRCPWPELHERRDRAGLSLRWDALTVAGDVLAAATMHPLHDGAHALLSGGADPDALVTLRHEGAGFDSFTPMPLRIPAAIGARRAEGRERLAERRAANAPERAVLRDRTPVSEGCGHE